MNMHLMLCVSDVVVWYQPSLPLAFKEDSLQWCHNEGDGISNHHHLYCLLNCWFRCRSKKTSKLRVTGLCVGNSPVTGEFPTQKASNAENVAREVILKNMENEWHAAIKSYNIITKTGWLFGIFVFQGLALVAWGTATTATIRMCCSHSRIT